MQNRRRRSLNAFIEMALIESAESSNRIERIVEQSKETYYETLNKSSQQWHEAKHDVLSWFNCFFGTIVAAYKEFEERDSHASPVRGAKTGIVEAAINRQLGEFRISDIERECPNVSRVMIK